METGWFSGDGVPVTAVTATEMRDVDRVAVEKFALGLLSMMENAGRNLAAEVRETSAGPVTVLAGDGGNGGGGLCAARHLSNRGREVSVVLDRAPDELTGAARTQFETLDAMGVPVGVGVGVDALASGPEPDGAPAAGALADDGVVVDALVGYGLSGPLRGTAADLVRVVDDHSGPVLSLDVPSGLDATTGEQPGVAVHPDRVLTLALPKTGLTAVDSPVVLADIAIPSGVYADLDVPYESPFRDGYRVSLDAR